MKKKARNWLLALFILAFPFALFCSFLIFMESEPLPPVAPLPNPNGYDTFLDAGKAVTEGSGDFDKMNEAQLRDLVGKNAAALALARVGLSNQCRVPIQYSESYISNHLDDLAALKRLSQAFAAEGMLAEMDGRTNDAIHSFLDNVHLGNEVMRGGVLIDGLVGGAIEAIGTSHLQTLAPHLDANTCRETAAALETLDSSGQSWDDVMQQENAWSHAAFRGWSYKLARWETRKSMNAMYASTRKNSTHGSKGRGS
jgi:hypothetical protein